MKILKDIKGLLLVLIMLCVIPSHLLADDKRITLERFVDAVVEKMIEMPVKSGSKEPVPLAFVDFCDILIEINGPYVKSKLEAFPEKPREKYQIVGGILQLYFRTNKPATFSLKALKENDTYGEVVQKVLKNVRVGTKVKASKRKIKKGNKLAKSDWPKVKNPYSQKSIVQPDEFIVLKFRYHDKVDAHEFIDHEKPNLQKGEITGLYDDDKAFRDIFNKVQLAMKRFGYKPWSLGPVITYEGHVTVTVTTYFTRIGRYKKRGDISKIRKFFDENYRVKERSLFGKADEWYGASCHYYRFYRNKSVERFTKKEFDFLSQRIEDLDVEDKDFEMLSQAPFHPIVQAALLKLSLKTKNKLIKLGIAALFQRKSGQPSRGLSLLVSKGINPRDIASYQPLGEALGVEALSDRERTALGQLTPETDAATQWLALDVLTSAPFVRAVKYALIKYLFHVKHPHHFRRVAAILIKKDSEILKFPEIKKRIDTIEQRKTECDDYFASLSNDGIDDLSNEEKKALDALFSKDSRELWFAFQTLSKADFKPVVKSRFLSLFFLNHYLPEVFQTWAAILLAEDAVLIEYLFSKKIIKEIDKKMVQRFSKNIKLTKERLLTLTKFTDFTTINTLVGMYTEQIPASGASKEHLIAIDAFFNQYSAVHTNYAYVASLYYRATDPFKLIIKGLKLTPTLFKKLKPEIISLFANPAKSAAHHQLFVKLIGEYGDIRDKPYLIPFYDEEYVFVDGAEKSIQERFDQKIREAKKQAKAKAKAEREKAAKALAKQKEEEKKRKDKEEKARKKALRDRSKALGRFDSIPSPGY